MGTISVSNLSKAYKSYNSHWARLIEWLGFGVHHRLTWILKDINFTIKQGEAVGIIGVNGAGKSTLLKLIAGTSHPTLGAILKTGKVVALLELGLGFHPDFTGRQNIFLAGQLLGYSNNEITSLLPQIEDFAELEEYIDKPLRIYSTGMQMRLAFSVATAVRPDILIVDEALSVGDIYFQHKCFEKIRQFRTAGTTLLIVSHDKQSILSICDRAIYIKNGSVFLDGNPESVLDFYNASLCENDQYQISQMNVQGGIQTTSGSNEAIIVGVNLFDENKEVVEFVAVGQRLYLDILVEIKEDIPELVVGFMIKDRLGQSIFGTNTHYLKEQLYNLHQKQKVRFIFEFEANLGSGTYSVAIALHTSHSHLEKNYEWRDRALMFNVVNVDKPEFVGIAWLPQELKVIK